MIVHSVFLFFEKEQVSVGIIFVWSAFLLSEQVCRSWFNVRLNNTDDGKNWFNVFFPWRAFSNK